MPSQYSDPPDGEPTMRELQRTLSSQKAAFRTAQAKEDEKSARRFREEMRKKEDPALRLTGRSASEPVIGMELNSNWSRCKSYSFGKPRHRKGNFGILVCDPRELEYDDARLGDGFSIPGVGHYVHPSTDGRQESDVALVTGGWTGLQHEIFMNTLRENSLEATPEFFRLLRQRLPQVPFWRLCDHVRWYAARERKESQQLRHIVKWREEHTHGVDPNFVSDMEMKERFGEARRMERLIQRADEEEAAAGSGRPRDVVMQNRQRNCLNEVLDNNLTGHQQFTKSPGYTFGSSREPRDRTLKRFTSSSQVRHSSPLDNPGPGHYCGLDEKIRLTRTMPVWSCRQHLAEAAVDRPASGAGPGYMGKLEGKSKDLTWKRLQQDLRATQDAKPTWSFGKEEQRFEKLSTSVRVVMDGRTPDVVGPGTYLGRGAPRSS